ncbi:flavodoxin-dependent (E)-4-hydroxy-3-methylbut-2-enyl-diphosphate synthase [Lentzea sp. NPDC051213]|uniref:flavodoxin-dependent (E)-4-hydroxy-3-methylbut-2-enyl-diphosphate synthase n=1 Tax=Lentzea sp. NPDC051213 TaxID=3364126 RepID=UPI00379B0814
MLVAPSTTLSTPAPAGWLSGRRATRQTVTGSVRLGSDHAVAVQASTDAHATVEALTTTVKRAAAVGCEIFRIERWEPAHCTCLAAVVRGSPIPIVAEIPATVEAMRYACKAGCAGVRVVVDDEERFRQNASGIARVAITAAMSIELVVGATVGTRFGRHRALLLAEAGLRNCAVLEEHSFTNLHLAVSCAEPSTTLQTIRMLAVACDYPLQLSLLQETGNMVDIARTAALCGQLLSEGIGDSVWLSSAGGPVVQAYIGREVLLALQVRS